MIVAESHPHESVVAPLQGLPAGLPRAPRQPSGCIFRTAVFDEAMRCRYPSAVAGAEDLPPYLQNRRGRPRPKRHQQGRPTGRARQAARPRLGRCVPLCSRSENMRSGRGALHLQSPPRPAVSARQQVTRRAAPGDHILHHASCPGRCRTPGSPAGPAESRTKSPWSATRRFRVLVDRIGAASHDPLEIGIPSGRAPMLPCIISSP